MARNEDPIGAFKPPSGRTPTQIEMHRRFLISQGAEQNAKLAAIDRQVKQKEAERATFKASIEKIKATLAPLQQRVEIRQQLFQKELGSKLTYLTRICRNMSHSSRKFLSADADPAKLMLLSLS